MKILITGASGQLGSELKSLAEEYPKLDFYFTDLNQLDITNMAEVQQFVFENNIKSIINCAAYTNVDKSESNQNTALEVNSFAVKNLVDVMETVSEGKLIHISTDYVFDGNSTIPYAESFDTNTINFYGKSKRAGEKHIESSSIDAIVIRTSWLYSIFGNNFVKTMLRLGNIKDSISVIYDQIGTPTNARDLAKVCLEIIQIPNRLDSKGKVFHYSNEGVASWYDFAKEIMNLANLNCEVLPILTKDYPETPAKRPHYSVMSKEKIKETFNLSIPHWKNSLQDCLNQLKN